MTDESVIQKCTVLQKFTNCLNDKYTVNITEMVWEKDIGNIDDYIKKTGGTVTGDFTTGLDGITQKLWNVERSSIIGQLSVCFKFKDEFLEKNYVKMYKEDMEEARDVCVNNYNGELFFKKVGFTEILLV